MHSLFSWISRIWSPFSYLKSETMSIISFDTNVTKNICYSKRNDFTKFFKICLSINKRSRRIAEIVDEVYAIILVK